MDFPGKFVFFKKSWFSQNYSKIGVKFASAQTEGPRAVLFFRKYMWQVLNISSDNYITREFEIPPSRSPPATNSSRGIYYFSEISQFA